MAMIPPPEPRQPEIPVPDICHTAMTTAATWNCVRSLAGQLAPRGMLAPGPVWTRLQVSGGAGKP